MNALGDFFDNYGELILVLVLISLLVSIVVYVAALMDNSDYAVAITTNGETFYCKAYDAETLIATDCKHAARMLVPADAAVSWR